MSAVGAQCARSNLVEDVWLQGKNFLRRHFYENKNFNKVKSSFLNFRSIRSSVETTIYCSSGDY